MAWDNRRRRVNQIEYSENGKAQIDIPRDYPIAGLLLNFIGSLVIGTAGSPVLKTGGAFGSAFRSCTRLEVIADGKNTILSISPTALAMKNLFLYGSGPQETIVGIDANTHPYGGQLYLPFAMPRSVRPNDTLVDASRFRTFILQASFGDGDSMFSTNATTLTSNDLDIEVHVDEALRLDGKRENYQLYKQHVTEKTITAATTNMQIPLPVNNRFRGIMIECESDDNMVNTILVSVEISSGTDVYYYAEADVLQGDNVRQFNLKQETLTGYYYIDFCPNGRLVNMLDARALSSLVMTVSVLNPGSADYIRVYPCEVIG